MSDLKFLINTDELAAAFGDIKIEVEEALNKSAKQLASMTHAKVVEMAQKELSSTREKYLSQLEFQEIVPGVWAITLNQPALFIEDGMQPHSMVDDLLRKNPKISKDGFRYKHIPFEHSKPSSEQTMQGKQLTSQLKELFKREGIPFKGIEKNADGSPRIGKLHTLQLGGARPTAKATSPAFDGVTVYQSMTRQGKVRRDVMTFRTVSDKSKAMGKWFHPGLTAKKFFEKAYDWAEKTWENEILPAVLDSYRS